jgi:hypothetical protein
MQKFLLPSFEGRENVICVISDTGVKSFLTQSVPFREEATKLGGCKLNTVETDTKHVLFVFNSKDEEVKRYYLGKKLQGKTPKELVEIMDSIAAFEAFNTKIKEWVPCVDIVRDYKKAQQIKYGCGLYTILQHNMWRVEDQEGNIIIPPGKYDFIDGFDKCGLARVKKNRKEDFINPEKSTKDVWGIVNTKGEEVLKLKYSEIWIFYNKKRRTTKVFEKYEIKDGEGIVTDWGCFEYEFDLYKLQLKAIDEEYENDYSIWDALDGEPEAAGNIDYEW